MKRITTILVAAAIFAIPMYGQGFLNLSFESAQNLPGNPGENGVSIPVADALPGWTAYDGDYAYADIYYVSNNFPGVATSVELEGGSLALSGDFSVGLYSNASISQTATVPDSAESLQFEATTPQDGLYVTLGGQSLSYSILSQGPSYSVYGANIPAGLDGQTSETLTFGMQGIGETLLDNIEFSTMSVPEPAEWALVGIGAIVVGARSRHKQARHVN